MRLTTETIEAPEFWAGYLNYASRDNLNQADIAEIEAWLHNEGLKQANFVDVSEDTFHAEFKLPVQGATFLFTMVTYTYITEAK